jgi:hypothetical protein
MSDAVSSFIGGLSIWLFACWVVVYAMSKRHDVSWGKFLLSGPLLFVQPSRFVRENRLRLVKFLGLSTLLCFLTGWILMWASNNIS